MSRASGDLVYWNAHTGFGEIDLDDGDGRIGIYRADLLRVCVRTLGSAITSISVLVLLLAA